MLRRETHIANQWLMSAVQGSSSIDNAKLAMAEGADPNSLNAQGLAAIHEAIRNDHLEMVQLLVHEIANQQAILANLNTVTHDFDPCIVVASKNNGAKSNRIPIMQEILRNRKMCDKNLLAEYIFVCVNALKGKNNLTESDFGLLAHYTSRLCGINIGEMINTENNDDRYLIHLCQYSGARVYNEAIRDDIELEGWSAYEFLPIRIFSLFEILVKLEAGAISVEDKIGWCEILKKEIVTEIETFKVEQERVMIADPAVEHEVSKELYHTLANRFVNNIREDSDQEFCLASGYRGHAIYIAFSLEKDSDSLLIRYDNLGVGIDANHKIIGGLVYPKVIKIENFTTKVSVIKDYITRLFLIKAERLPDRHPKNSTKEELESAETKYKQARDSKVAEIYDADRRLGYVEVLSQQFGLPEQMAETCVATSHQVGLLSRLKDELFYKWVLAEEKRCIVQAGRNQGALLATNRPFWEVRVHDFKVPKYFDCCPRSQMDIFIKDDDIIRELYTIENIEINREAICFLRRTFDEDDYNELKALCLFIEEKKDNDKIIPSGLRALFLLKLWFQEKGLVEKFQCLNKSRDILECALKIPQYHDKLSELYFNYFLGLIFYALNQIDLSQSFFSKCTNLTARYLNGMSNKNNYYGIQQVHASNESQQQEELARLKSNSEISQGFLYIEQEKYTDASRLFETTVSKSSTRNGMTYIGQVFSYYPAEALFGLGIVKYLEAVNRQDINLVKEGLKSALECFKGISNKSSDFFYKALEYIEKIQVELDSRIRDAKKPESVSLTPLFHANKLVQANSGEEPDIKRHRVEVLKQKI